MHMFILTADQELWARELMYHIMRCDHSLGFKEFLDKLNLLYIWICLYLQQIKSYGHASQ
jgi:hypothetical protein